MIAHELAHIRRLDGWINLLQIVTETLLFFHPAVWWVSGQIRHEREHCCDELAASACGGRVVVAQALTALERLREPEPSMALGASGGSLLRRIQSLAGKRRASTFGSARSLVLGIALWSAVLGVGILCGVSADQARGIGSVAPDASVVAAETVDAEESKGWRELSTHGT